MPSVNFLSREIDLKISYVGPEASGKVTSARHVYRCVDAHLRGKPNPPSPTNDEVLSFDFLPPDVGRVRGFSIRVHVYVARNDLSYPPSPSSLLSKVDGILFVADSRPERRRHNLGSLQQLHVDLESFSLEPDAVPIVLQYNHRDASEAMSIDEMERDLNDRERPFTATIATTGEGVIRALNSCLVLVLAKLAPPTA